MRAQNLLGDLVRRRAHWHWQRVRQTDALRRGMVAKLMSMQAYARMHARVEQHRLTTGCATVALYIESCIMHDYICMSP